MFCKYCGAQINENSAFCKKCGKPMTAAHDISNGMQNSPIYNQPPKERFKGLAIAGFILGAVGLLFFPILGLLSLIFGIIAFVSNPREQGEMTKAICKYKNKARGFGVVSISLGIICIIFLILSIALSVVSAPFSPFNFNFGPKIDETSCKSIVREHMRDVHKVPMEPFVDGGINRTSESIHEAEVNLNDTGAIVQFKVYRSVDGIYLEMPNTIQLDKKGKVVSCEWCRLGINDEQDVITSTNPEPNPDQPSSADERVPSHSTCPRCGRTFTYGETSCDCTWCDICNAWMLGHGHGEGEEPEDSSAAQSKNDSASAQSGSGATDEYDYSFEGQEITIVRYRSNNRSGVVIPATIDGKRVTKIGNGAFDIGINNNVIESVIIPNGVTEIGRNVFRFCHGLTSIKIPKSVTTIGSMAFDETNISSVYFEGNAPSGTGVLSRKSIYKVYYKSGTTGWDNEIWSDFPKETW